MMMPSPPPIDFADKRTLDTFIWLLLIALFALFGASAKLLYSWHPTPWTRTLGSLMTSIFAAWLVGLSIWRFVGQSPELLFVATGSAAWIGGEVIDRIVRRWERAFFPGPPPPPSSYDTPR